MPVILLRLSWIALLLAPNLTTLAFANAWETDPRVLLLVSAGLVAFLYGLLPPRLFLAVTCPIIIAGAAVLGADWHASANLLELVSVAYSFKPGEAANAVRPYWPALALCITFALVLMMVLWRAKGPAQLPGRARLAVGALALAAAGLVPATVWFAAWPLNLLAAIASSQSLDVGIALSQVTTIRASPRDRFSSWSATREQAPAERETFVLVIGETIRSDRFPGCGGRPEMTALAGDAFVYCDVLAGAGNTHASVPLLVSRELPGHADRVSRDATFLRAFEEVGFETYWLAVQPRSIAWPDARNQWFHLEPGLDRDLLLPQLQQALARPAPRKLIVLHAYNAHAPYTDRYRAADAPFRVEAGKVGSDAAVRWNAYDNAVDESVRFLRAVLDQLRSEPGAAFVVYTPDHGENMEDDGRHLRDHALKFPTLWDTRVPAVVWANSAWRQGHPQQWNSLALNRDRPLMHMDIAPTMLGAAGIVYDERRALPVDLTSRLVPSRRRFTQLRAGQTVELETLRREAGVPAP